MKPLLLSLSTYGGDINRAIRLAEYIRTLGCVKDYDALVTAAPSVSQADLERLLVIMRDAFNNVHLQRLVTEVMAERRDDGQKDWTPHNFMFAQVSGYISINLNGYRAFYFMEPDCTPLRKTWLQDLESEYLQNGRPAMGKIKEGFTTDGKLIGLFMNGSAIYPSDIFHRVPKAKMASVLPHTESIPWDIFSRQEMLQIAAQTELIEVNFLLSPFDKEKVGKLPSKAVVFHGDKDHTLLEILDGQKHVATKPVPQPVVEVERMIEEPNPKFTKLAAEDGKHTAESDMALLRAILERGLITVNHFQLIGRASEKYKKAVYKHPTEYAAKKK